MESNINDVLIALRDPMGVPLFPVVFQLLMVLTFALHILFVNFVVGGLGLSLWGWFRGGANWKRLSATTAKMASFSVSFAILIGVAPLLFVQVIYDPFWYASNSLSAAWVIGFLFIMMASYSVTYLYYLRHDKGRPGTVIWGLLALAGFLLAGFVMHALNYQAMLPEQWLGWASDAAGGGAATSGTALHAHQWSRYLHVIFASPAITGLLLMVYAWYFSPRPDMDPAYLNWVGRLGANLAFGFSVITALTGLWWSVEIPAGFAFHANPVYLASVVLALGLLGYLWVARREPVRYAIPASVAAFVVVLAMSASREALRMAYVGQFGYSVFDYPVNLDWGSTVLFFGTFLWGFIAISYLLTVAFRSGRAASTVDLAATGVARFGTFAIGSLVAWIAVMVVLGVYITIANLG